MRERRAVHTVAIMTLATLFSKILGALRNALFSAPFGTGQEAVAFTAAQRIPLSFFDILLSAAITGCFIPAYNSFREDLQPKRRDSFTAAFLLTVTLVTAVLTAVGEIFAPQLIFTTVPNLDPDTHTLAVRLLRIMFPSVIFIGGCYVMSGILQSRGSFILPALVSSGSNLLAAAYLIFSGRFPKRTAIVYLAAVYTLSWAAQFLTLLIPLVFRGGFPRSRPSFQTKEFRDAVTGIPPAALGAWLGPAALLIGTFFASASSTHGGVSVFDYSYNIYIIAAGVLTHGISGYIFPSISRLAGLGDPDGFSQTVKKALLSSLFLTLPFSALLFILSGEAVSVLYLRDSFTAADAFSVSGLLRVMALSVPFYSVADILIRVFYAKKLRGVPIIAALCGIAATVSAAFVSQKLSDGNILSVGIGYGAGQLTATSVMLFSLRKADIHFSVKGALRHISRTVFPALFAIIMMTAVYSIAKNDPVRAGTTKNILVSAAVFTAGAIPYLTGFLYKKLKHTGKEDRT